MVVVGLFQFQIVAHYEVKNYTLSEKHALDVIMSAILRILKMLIRKWERNNSAIIAYI